MITVAAGVIAAPAVGGASTTATNPVAGSWGSGAWIADGVYPAYQAATGTHRRLIGKIALRPRVRWFGGWVSAHDVKGQVRDYITKVQDGDPNAVVQMVTFRLWRGGEHNKNLPLSTAWQDAYRRWVDAVARGIGSSRVMVIVEQDLPLALHGWRPAVRLRLARYAAKTFSALPRTSVYIDAGASDWLAPDKATAMLKSAGIGLSRVRGFALNGTHYDSTVRNIRHGRRIVGDLAHAGISGKHFVINTADTGRPFTWAWYVKHHPNGHYANAATCATKSATHCVTLGIPPTTDVANPAWHLPDWAAALARRWCDGYAWYGRPWLTGQARPFNRTRTLAIARTTPY